MRACVRPVTARILSGGILAFWLVPPASACVHPRAQARPCAGAVFVLISKLGERVFLTFRLIAAGILNPLLWQALDIKTNGKNSTVDESRFSKMIFAIEYKVVCLNYENITRNKKYPG